MDNIGEVLGLERSLLDKLAGWPLNVTVPETSKRRGPPPPHPASKRPQAAGTTPPGDAVTPGAARRCLGVVCAAGRSVSRHPCPS
jgi:hypothetical protein